MRKIFILLAVSLQFLTAQELSSVRICLDPGHSGHESDDRFISETGFWESESNLDKAFKLEKLLLGEGASVRLTRRGNNNTTDDLSLSERVAVANTFNADIFISIHSNGFNGGANYSMAIFNGTTENPRIPAGKDLAAELAPEIFAADRTTRDVVIGDLTLNPTWTNGYGVLYPANMPAVITEGSFHDHIPESWRLMNVSYRQNESWAIFRGILAYFNKAQSPYASLAGIVGDVSRPSGWNHLVPRDARLPVNNITVKLEPGGKTYQGDEFNNGFFVFDSLTPGEYQLVVSAPLYDGDTNTVSISAGKTNFSDFLLHDKGTLPPAAPSRIWMPYNDELLRAHIQFSEVENADRYYLIIYNNDSSAIDTLSSTSSEFSVQLASGQAHYFRTAAGNSAGMSEISRRLYGFGRVYSGRKVLLVNGFDRGTNTHFDYVKYYGAAILNADHGFDYALNEDITGNRVNLQDYQTVIWMLGDESTADETFSAAEQAYVKTYLEAGRNLFVSGSEIGWDLDEKGGSSDRSFYNNYLKADYAADAPANTQGVYYTAAGVSGSLFEGVSGITFDNGSHGTYDVDWPDALTTYGGSEVVMTYTGVSSYKNAGVVYRGTFGDSGDHSKLVYLAIPFESIYPAASRIAVMDRILRYFDPAVGIEDGDKSLGMAEDMRLLPAYPNPFNASVNIVYELVGAGEVDLSVFDLKGGLVCRLVEDRQLQAGRYELTWNGRSLHGAEMASGIYIIRLQQGQTQQVQKIIMQK